MIETWIHNGITFTAQKTSTGVWRVFDAEGNYYGKWMNPPKGQDIEPLDKGLGPPSIAETC
jgi:hypothetical protein